MLRSGIIPCLLLHDGGLVKTRQFKDAKYVGDPLNAVKIFNEKEIDELMLLDIDATAQGRSPDFGLLKNIAAESRMPLCYGGAFTVPNKRCKLLRWDLKKCLSAQRHWRARL